MEQWAGKPRFAWRGELRLRDRWATWQGGIGDGELHRHFAAQAILSATPVQVFDANGGHVEAHCVLVDPLVPHRIASGGEALLVYLEPGTRIDDELHDTLRPIATSLTRAVLGSSVEFQFWARWLSGPDQPRTVSDLRIAEALGLIENSLSGGALSLPVIAARSKLSVHHFRHLFVEQIGTPFTRYVLWRRLRLAATELAAGQDVTASAHAAGFSDAAHFARTIKSTFGITASQALLPR